MNPPLPLSILLPLLALALVLADWLSWRSSAGLPTGRRATLLLLRMLGVAAVCALLLNPGKWVRPTEDRERPWLVLLDQSASMAQPAEEGSRADEAKAHAETLAKLVPKEVPVRYHPFDTVAAPAIAELSQMGAPVGTGSDLHGSLKRLVEEAASAGDSFAGVLALTDGRQTAQPSDAELESLALRLRSRKTPFHAIAIGAGIPPRDLVVRVTRPTVTVFKGQKARIPIAVEADGLGPQKPDVNLIDEAGKPLATINVEVLPGKTAFAVFEVDAPAASARWSIQTAALPEETNPGNNRGHVNIRLLESKTRVFLAEGAPYWDSKFLAQLLRQQTQMEVHSVHRLSDERYFRIDSGEAEPTETPQAVFPETLDELSRYDLVIFGKNVDAFLTPSRLEALRSYVRDRGGAVLFARGKPVTGTLPGLDALEPVTWASTTVGDFRFLPAADGEAAGLFGEALPPASASLWTSLPTLKDARQISMVKPFTRVLASGRDESGSGFSKDIPSLLVRRYGQGVCGLVNGDGLWKWDFYPEARELGNMYEDFWTQLIQWMASYSEFLPGQDFSLRLPSLRGRAGDAVSVSMSYRGSGTVPSPVLRIISPEGKPTDLQPAAYPDPGGHPHWRASFTPDAPGAWKLSVVDPREKAPPAPEASYLVPAPPLESDNLAADPVFLGSLADATGGSLIAPADLPAFLSKSFTPEAPTARSSGAIWQPSWTRWWFALLIAVPLALEWYLRRRQGLA
ncbi:hypothetical protein OKA04_13220 [Luteolibacter flavescens]|uniref:VWA domain-containing protein n=1 Tax=Luteolibacter flavescens TaxID=1859460 RepID=A0ABT3FR68_9BACT|nr:hypothetical protein [Luteolibacter flavescens]MCW1885694.1 hypothetical protein [Luteolibacter flavescens]